jgi:acyl-coenzyme A synthetase/AMP-(fatty) acid ligase
MITRIESIRQLSPIQQDFLSGYLIDSSMLSYTSQWIGFYNQIIRSDQFLEAWKLVVKRHSILRTAFDWENPSRPVQVVLNSVDPQVLTHVVADCDSFDSFQNRVKEIGKIRYEKGFDIKKPPLMDFEIVLSHQWSAIIWSRHHLVTDGWSLSALYNELFELYADNPSSHALVTEAQPYSQFVDALTSLVDNEKDFDYWSEYLQSQNPNIYETHSTRSKCILETRSYSADFLRDIKKTAIILRVTPNTLFIATLLDALVRLFGTEQCCLGIAEMLSGVTADEELIIGPKITTLPFFGKPIQESSLSDDLREVHRRLLSHRSHAYASLKDVVGKINTPRFSYRALFNTCYVYQNYPSVNHDTTKDRLYLVDEVDISEPGSPLLVVVEPSSSGLKMRVMSKDVQVNAEDVRLLLENWEESLHLLTRKAYSLTSAVASSSDKPSFLAQGLPIGTSAILSKIKLTAQTSPEREALVDPLRSVTYSELWQKIQEKTAEIQASMKGLGDIILVRVSDAIEDVVNILSVWNSGHAHLAVDATTPAWSLYKIYREKRVVGVIAEKMIVSKQGTKGNNHEDKIKKLAYCVASSGSTGAPKIIAVLQDNVESHRAARLNRYHSDDRILLSYPLIFDGALTVILSCFDAGATLVLPKRVELTDGRQVLATDKLEEIILDLDVTALNMLPSLLRTLLKSSSSKVSKRLRHVVLAAEALYTSEWATIDDILDKETRVFNEYGPSETTICATEFEIDRSQRYTDATIPVGFPLEGAHIKIVDKDKNILDRGEVGEILIAGKIVAEGYLNNEDLTQKSFDIINIDGKQEPAYLSGDLGYINSRGELVWVGRKDSETKINGVRVSTQVVEALLQQMKGAVEVSTVIENDNNNDEQRLVSFIALHKDVEASNWELEAKTLLASRKLFHKLVFVDKLPRLANGKVDVVSLRTRQKNTNSPSAPVSIQIGQGSEAQADPDKLQSVILMFEEVLAIDSISPFHSFFTQGGTSLKAMALAALCRKKIGLYLQVSDIFELETPLAIATQWKMINGRNRSGNNERPSISKKNRWN